MTSQASTPIAAIPYTEGMYPEALFGELARAFRARGERLAGVIQRDVAQPGRPCCDMLLDDLATGTTIRISEDRGPEARGCRIDMAGLSEAAEAISRAIRDCSPTLIIINKFGKVECEGGGLREVIGEAVGNGIPVIVGVPERNLPELRSFAGNMATVLPADRDTVLDWHAALVLSPA